MTGTEISLIDPSALTGDDAMAFNFLTRAANAILAIPSLSTSLRDVNEELAWIRTERDTLRAIEADQAQRIALLEAQLASTQEAERDWRERYVDMEALRDARQRDIDLLDDRVAKLAAWREEETARADGFKRDYEQTFDAYTLAQTKLEKMQRILGALTEDEVEEVPEPEPKARAETYEEAVARAFTLPDEHHQMEDHNVIGDGLDHPDYRREAEPEASRTLQEAGYDSNYAFATRGDGDQEDVIDLHS